MRVVKRRSDRVTLTCPVMVRVVDEQGEALEIEGRTTSINRHGARIEISKSLLGQQLLRLVNPASQQEASFRVVGLMSTAPGGGGVYAVQGPLAPETPSGDGFGAESVDGKAGFWGLYFPPLPLNEAAERKVTLECRQCRGTRALELSMVELDVLESSGGLSRPCDSCHVVSQWRYPERRMSLGDAPTLGAIEDVVSRETRRVSLQLPVRVRRPSGEAEHTHSEDVSKNGFSFVSEIDYEIGEGVMVACPFSAQTPNAEVKAQIARKQEIKGTGRKVFGVRYEQVRDGGN